MEWQIAPEVEDVVIGVYKSYVAPTIKQSPDVLRIRLYKVDNATTLQGSSHETKEKSTLHSYFTLLEFATEEYPWDVVLELAEHELWKKYFEKQTGDVVSRFCI